MTATMIFSAEHEENQIKSTIWQINYLFIESKSPIPRGIETPKIPSSLAIEYNIECMPRIISEINLQKDEFLKEFKTPINLDIFEHPVINYLLQKELSPNYLEALLKNLKYSNSIKSEKPLSQFRPIQLEELTTLQAEIKKASDKLENYLVKVDNLTNHKSTLEVNLHQDSAKETQTFTHQDLLTNIKIHQEMEKNLNLKYHHLKSVEQTHLNHNNPNQNTHDPNSKSAISDLLIYYQSRILNDLEIIRHQLETLQAKEHQVNRRIIQPQDETNHQVQTELDETLLNYRKARKTCLVIKAHLDEKIPKFLTLFYHHLHQQNYAIH